MIFNEVGVFSDLNHRNGDELEELLQIQRDAVNESLTKGGQDPGVNRRSKRR